MADVIDIGELALRMRRLASTGIRDLLEDQAPPIAEQGIKILQGEMGKVMTKRTGSVFGDQAMGSTTEDTPDGVDVTVFSTHPSFDIHNEGGTITARPGGALAIPIGPGGSYDSPRDVPLKLVPIYKTGSDRGVMLDPKSGQVYFILVPEVTLPALGYSDPTLDIWEDETTDALDAGLVELVEGLTA